MLEISSGKVRGIIQYLRDITQREQAAEALQQSEEKYRLLVNQIPAIVFKGYADWSVDFFDNKIEALTGYSKEEFDSRQIKWCNLILPEDLEQAKGRFIQGIKTGGAYGREYRLRKKDGGIAWIQAMGQIFYDAEGKLDYISGVFFDITERVLAEQKLRESNERFAAVFENAAIGISVTDAQGRIIAANPRFQEMLGYHAGELPAKTFPEITHPEDLPKNLELFQEMMTGKSEGYLLEKRYLRKNGEYFWAQVTVSSIKETKGQPPYSIAVVEDITPRKQTQEKLEESERNLRYLAAQLLTAQERERQRISRDLHDDLGQSLVALKLHLEAIEREEPANLTVIRQKLAIQTAFIDDIVNNVRRLCMDLRPTTLDVLGLIMALKRLFKEFSALYGIKFSLDLDEVRNLLSPQAQIIIYRIFQEALTNIAKYAQATRATVTIKRENDKVSFTMQDNGKGFNLEQVRARKDGKRGLGLAAMEERVRMLGGTLEMQSQKGVGTRISFKIPVSLLRHSKGGN
jgi:PAS domain S-box-containing protein